MMTRFLFVEAELMKRQGSEGQDGDVLMRNRCSSKMQATGEENRTGDRA